MTTYNVNVLLATWVIDAEDEASAEDWVSNQIKGQFGARVREAATLVTEER